YQRYQLTSRIVSVLSPPDSGKLRILDVGGSSSSLKHFLPNDEILLADVQGPPAYTYRENVAFRHDGYVLASGGDLPFADDCCDVVTAHDTLEHVPEQNRARFLRDLIRVSRRYVILHGPVYHPEIERAERRLALFMKRAFSGSNPSLDEHIGLGLPRREAIEDVLTEENLSFVTVPNGNLLRWLAMMTLKHYLISFPASEAAHEELDRAYNALVSEDDFGGLCYRKAYVIALNRDDAKALDLVASGYQTADAVADKTDIATLEGLLAALEGHAGLQRRTTAQQVEQIQELHIALGRLRTQIDRRDAIIREGEAVLERRERALEEASAQLAAISGSLGYRSLEAYRRRMRWLFPPGSARALPYRALRRTFAMLYRAPWRRVPGRLRRVRRLARRSREIIRNEGWRAFLQRARRRLRGERPLVTAPIPIDYQEWIAATEPDARELLRQTDVALTLPYRPLISIITPVWNPEPEHLRQTIDSVMGQTYDNWELCLVDGGSRDLRVRQVLEQFASRNDKIRVKLLEKNLGISGNSNAGLTLASGEFVAFLDHTDLLEPNALWEVAILLNRNPSLDCIYSDEDFVSEDGARRFNPLFKPQWSPDIMLSANYLAHFRVLRRSVVDDLNGERSEMDGAQDWDLLLRLSEKTERISRVPKVLYHWRADSTSAGGGIDNKPYALGAQIRAVQSHLDRRGLRGQVHQDAEGVMRVRWSVSGDTRVSIIIPTRHNRKLLESCLRGGERELYLSPRDHRIGAKVIGPLPPGAVCAWFFHDGDTPPQQLSAPCEEEVRGRVRFRRPTIVTVDATTPDQ
ncbi:MAG: glycosyltransferase, partial [Gammaproteobacteria bacterium]